MDHNKLWEILIEMGILDYLTCLLRNLYAGQEATEPDMEQWSGSKLGIESDSPLYSLHAYITSMKSTPCTMLGWMNHKLESRLSGGKKKNKRKLRKQTNKQKDCPGKYEQPQICR